MPLPVQQRTVVAHRPGKAELERAGRISHHALVDIVPLEPPNLQKVRDRKRALRADAHGVRAVERVNDHGSLERLSLRACRDDRADRMVVVERVPARVHMEFETARRMAHGHRIVLPQRRVEVDVHVKVVVDEIDPPFAAGGNLARNVREGVDVGKRRVQVQRGQQWTDIVLLRGPPHLAVKLLRLEINRAGTVQGHPLVLIRPVQSHALHRQPVPFDLDVGHHALRRHAQDVRPLKD